MDVVAVMQGVGVSLSDPKVVGKGKVLRSGYATADFWDLWRNQKDKLRKAGISPKKTEDGKWLVHFWQEHSQVLIDSGVQEKDRKKSFKAISKATKKLLRPHQLQHTSSLIAALQTIGAYLDGSDTGTGKTYTTLALCKEQQLIPAVVCRKSAITAWRRVCDYFGLRPLFVLNYEAIKTGKTEWLCVEDAGEKKELLWVLPKKKPLLIFDEAHWARNPKTINAEMVRAAHKAELPMAFLSATLADNPFHFRVFGPVLQLFERASEFWAWGRNHGLYKGVYGFEFNPEDLESIQRIHQSVYGTGRGARMRIADLPEGAFPHSQIIPRLVDTGNEKEISEVYSNLFNVLQGGNLGERQSARQAVELHKVDSFVEFALDLLEEGKSVLIFVNFLDSQRRIIEALRKKKVDTGWINGSRKQADRDYDIERFQKNEIRAMVLQSQAGGESISLHDLEGNHPRVSIISPTDDAKLMKQVFGRAARDGAKSDVVQYLFYAANTIEEEVCDNVALKIDRIDMFNDGDFEPFMVKSYE